MVDGDLALSIACFRRIVNLNLSNCPNLTHVDLNHRESNINTLNFDNCPRLKDLYLPNNYYLRNLNLNNCISLDRLAPSIGPQLYNRNLNRLNLNNCINLSPMHYRNLITQNINFLQRLDLNFNNPLDPKVVNLQQEFEYIIVNHLLVLTTRNIQTSCNIIRNLSINNIPNINIANISLLNNLTSLKINKSINLYNFDSLSQLNLNVLHITSCKVVNDNILPIISNFRNLTELNLSQTEVTNNIITILNRFPNLIYLDLSYTRIRDLSMLRNNANNPSLPNMPDFILSNTQTPHLQTLILHHTNINYNNLTELYTIGTLQVLNISDCKYITNDIITHINRIPNLIYLNLVNTTLKFGDIARIRQHPRQQRLNVIT